MGAAIEAFHALFHGVALLVPDQHDPEFPEAGETRSQGTVVADGPVAVKLDKLFKDEIHVIQGLRPLGMAGKLHRLPRGEVAVLFALEIEQRPPHPAHFVICPRLAVALASSLDRRSSIS